MTSSYYSDKLAAERLQRCYELAPPAVQRFLEVESQYVRQRIRPTDRVLELGCGYGRVLEDLGVPEQGMLVGIVKRIIITMVFQKFAEITVVVVAYRLVQGEGLACHFHNDSGIFNGKVSSLSCFFGGGFSP